MQGVWVGRTGGIAVVGALVALAVGLIGGAGSAGAAVGDTDLSMTKTDTADPVTVGDTFAYGLAAKKGGANDAADVMTTDTLPSKISYVSATPSAGTCEKA